MLVLHVCLVLHADLKRAYLRCSTLWRRLQSRQP